MGNINSTSTTQIQKIINSLKQSYHLDSLNQLTNEQRNQLKSEIISNYIQNMTVRNINKNEYQHNLERVAEGTAKAIGENVIAYDTIKISGNKGKYENIQKNVETGKLTMALEQLFKTASNIIANASADEVTEAAMQADQDLTTFNESCQKAISNILAEGESTNQAEFEQSMDKDIPDVKLAEMDMSLISLPKLNASTSKSYQNLYSNTNTEIDTEQVMRNIQSYLLSNNQEFVQHLNSSIEKILENVTENTSKVDDVVKQKVESIAQGKNVMKGDMLIIENNEDDVKIYQSNELQAEAVAEMLVQDIFTNEQSSTMAVTMADMLDLGSSTKSSTSNIGSQTTEASQSVSAKLSNFISSKQGQSIIGAVIVAVVMIIGTILIFKLRNQREKDKLDHGYAPTSHMLINSATNLANNAMGVTRNPLYNQQPVPVQKPSQPIVSTQQPVQPVPVQKPSQPIASTNNITESSPLKKESTITINPK